jgi:predicted nucleic acid-binding protein
MLIDSNVLIYALNPTSPKNKTAILYLRAEIKQTTVAHQNILEVTRVMSHPVFPVQLSFATVVKSVEQLTKPMRMVYPNEETYYVYQRLVKKYQIGGNRVFDLYLVATAITNEEREIVTDNEKHLGIFEEIKVINPFISAQK